VEAAPGSCSSCDEPVKPAIPAITRSSPGFDAAFCGSPGVATKKRAQDALVEVNIDEKAIGRAHR